MDGDLRANGVRGEQDSLPYACARHSKEQDRQSRPAPLMKL